MATQTYTNNVTLSDAAEFNRFDTAAYAVLSGVGGTANAITATGPANYSLSAALPVMWFVPGSTNTGATTIAITPSGSSVLTTKNIFAWGAACIGGEIVSGRPCGIIYDGTQFNLINPQPAASTFTATLTGCTTSPTYTVKYTKVGNVITLMVSVGSAITGTSNATTKTLTGMPAGIRPSATTTWYNYGIGSDNGGSFAAGAVNIASTGVISLFPTLNGGNWTNSGTFTFNDFLVSYTTA